MILLRCTYQDSSWWDLDDADRQAIMDVVGGDDLRAFTIIQDEEDDQFILLAVETMRTIDGNIMIRGHEVLHVLRIERMDKEDFIPAMQRLRRQQVKAR